MICMYLAVLLVLIKLIIMRKKTRLILLPRLLFDKALWTHQKKILSNIINLVILGVCEQLSTMERPHAVCTVMHDWLTNYRKNLWLII
jgi:hypothetical protein